MRRLRRRRGPLKSTLLRYIWRLFYIKRAWFYGATMEGEAFLTAGVRPDKGCFW